MGKISCFVRLFVYGVVIVAGGFTTIRSEQLTTEFLGIYLVFTGAFWSGIVTQEIVNWWNAPVPSHKELMSKKGVM